MFSDYGMPATFYNDHYEFLIGQDSLFARKIRAGATALRQRLGALYNSKPRMREKIYINLSRNVGAQDYGSRRVFGNWKAQLVAIVNYASLFVKNGMLQSELLKKCARMLKCRF